VRALVVVAVVLAASTARAQPEERLPGIAEQPGEHAEAAEHHGEGDPTADFNFTNFKWGEKNAEGESTPPPFVLLVGNFVLMLLILAYFGRPAARKLAEQRHDEIKSALDEAGKLRDEAKQKLAEYEGRIKSLDSDIQKLVDGIRADADADKARIVAQAEAQAAQLKRDAELRIAAEIELARAELRREVSVAAAAATEKLLRDKTTADDHQRLVQTFLGSVGKSGPARKEQG
jgi:F-type H+-transporting ATPase subunit b